MDLLLQTFDLGFEVFLFFGVVLRFASQPVPAASDTAAAILRSAYGAFAPFQNGNKPRSE